MKANTDRFTRVNFSDNDSCAEIFTSRPRMLYRMRKLHELFPDECKLIEKTKDDFSTVEHWQCPFFWFNCRKRPEPVNKPPYQKAKQAKPSK